MAFVALPLTAAWQHLQARSGFEVVYFEMVDDGYHLRGCTAAIEDGQTWVVEYEIDLDTSWVTRSARIAGRSTAGLRRTLLQCDGEARWRINGVPAPHLNGCLDVDLESSAMTNALPVHRTDLAVGQTAATPAAYVRALDLAVERLEQTYQRIADDGTQRRYEYTAPDLDFACRLDYDDSGLLLNHPGIAARAG